MKVVDDKKWTWHSFFFYKKSLELCGKLFENIRKRPLTAACEYLRIKERIFENLNQQTMRTSAENSLNI